MNNNVNKLLEGLAAKQKQLGKLYNYIWLLSMAGMSCIICSTFYYTVWSQTTSNTVFISGILLLMYAGIVRTRQLGCIKADIDGLLNLREKISSKELSKVEEKAMSFEINSLSHGHRV